MSKRPGRGHSTRRTTNNRKERLQRADLTEPERFYPWDELETNSPDETQATDDTAS